MITPDTVDHLAGVQALDLEIFAEAMREASADPAEATAAIARGLSGTQRLPGVIARLSALLVHWGERSHVRCQ